MPQPSPYLVADDGAAHRAGDDEPRLRGCVTDVTGSSQVHDHQRCCETAGPATASTQCCNEVGTPPQPCPGREHAGQAESRERPLARRPARMARPARVRIRRRNPWVFARRRLFGWKVRLLTRGLPYDGLERRQQCLSQGGEPCDRPLSDVHDATKAVDSMDTRQRPSGRLDRLTVRAFVLPGQTEPGRADSGTTEREPATLTGQPAASSRDTPPSVHIAAKKPAGCGQPLAGVPWCG